MNQWITDYVKGCHVCQQNKILTRKRNTPLFRIHTQSGTLPFQQVAMDLITGLPKHKGYDAILTIVDHGCSRAATFLPCTTTVTGPEIAQLYLDNVARWFGLPTKLITDRDPRFTSHFSKALCRKLKITQTLSTAFHPQTDGISERKNQWVEQYLRLVTSTAPEDWTHWLAIATAVHNNRKNATTGLSPNQVLLGYETQLHTQQTPPSNNQTAEERITLLRERHNQATDAINRTAQKGQPLKPQYVPGDQVWLEATNLKIKHQKTKLNPKRYGPFRITKVISPVAYQLALPPSWGIHDVFHASLLTPYHETDTHGPNFSRPPPVLINGEEEYQVERIISHCLQGRSKKLHFLIKWEGYPDSDNTWEPAQSVHAPDRIKEYLTRTGQKDLKTPATSVKACIPAPHSSLGPPTSTSALSSSP